MPVHHADVETILGWAVAHAVLLEPEVVPGSVVPSDATANADANTSTSASSAPQAQPDLTSSPASAPVLATTESPSDAAAAAAEGGQEGVVPLVRQDAGQAPAGEGLSAVAQIQTERSGGPLPQGLAEGAAAAQGAPGEIHATEISSIPPASAGAGTVASTSGSASDSAGGGVGLAAKGKGSGGIHADSGIKGGKDGRKVAEEGEEDGDSEDEDDEEEILVVPAAR